MGLAYYEHAQTMSGPFKIDLNWDIAPWTKSSIPMLAPSTLPLVQVRVLTPETQGSLVESHEQTHTPKEQVLQNDYLLREIFGYLESYSKRQLLAAALACRTFLEPAQDCLWRSMHSLLPFWNLLPSVQLIFGVQVCSIHMKYQVPYLEQLESFIDYHGQQTSFILPPV